MATSGGEGAGGGGADGGGARGPDAAGARAEMPSTQHAKAATHATRQGEPIGTLSADGDGRCVLLSWGHNDRETYSTTLPLRLLFGSAMEWVPLRAGDPSTTTDCS